MIEISEALSLVLSRAKPKPPQHASLSAALGRVLAEDVASDVDSPPHDKSMVDGYAIVAADMASGVAELRVLEEVTAGAVPTKAVRPGWATRIMTGAPIPQGADCVVMVEQTELLEGAGDVSVVKIQASKARSGQNILPRGISLKQGDVVLHAGYVLNSIKIGLLAEVGHPKVLTIPPATVAVLATGNELVDAAAKPAAGQIRNSNGPMLAAQIANAGANSVDLGFARDDRSDLERLIRQSLEADMLVLSGGVSAGVLDLVPAVLESLGVRQVFHKVRLKPGKPLWFGVLDGGERETLVFGLPGNPVGSLVCFELFARPALDLMAGKTTPSYEGRTARLTQPHQQKGDRPTYWPARLSIVDQIASVTPLAWKGSADLRTLADANCFAFFPAGDRLYEPGEEVSVREIV